MKKLFWLTNIQFHSDLIIVCKSCN